MKALRLCAVLFASACSSHEPNSTRTADPSAGEPATRRGIEDQANVSEAESAYRSALAKKAKQDLDGAFREAGRALQIDPSHREARALFRELSELLGHPGPLQADRAAELYDVRRRETLIELENLINEGERLYASREYDRALDRFERAEILAASVPDENIRGQYALTLRRRISEIKQSR
jgi:tetratricopeptide (TPR) repeat protein